MTNINTTKVLSTLVNPDKILPVAAIEAFTTAGRVYHGYKRGGEEEGRERLREETTGAVFWLFGQKVLNSFGDFIGEKCGIKNINVDVPLEIHVFGGENASFNLYEDDGETLKYKNGNYSIIPFKWNDRTKEFIVGERIGDYAVKDRDLIIKLKGKDVIKRIKYSGKEIKVILK